MGSNESLVKLTFPKFEDHAERSRFYIQMNIQFDKKGYVYGEHYKYEWLDTGKHVPDYLWVESDIALIFILRYDCHRAT